MKKVYILFDIFTFEQSGGLVATYERLVNLLNDTYDFTILSVFNCGVKNDVRFPNVDIFNLSSVKTNINLGECVYYFKQMRFLKCFYILFSVLYYIVFAPIARMRIKKIVRDDIVICVSPAAAFFMPKKTKFILEIHTQFEYFFGNNLLGKIQGKLMRTPTIALFRTKLDAEKAENILNSDYIYNFYEGNEIKGSYDYENRKNKIIFIGRLVKEKNPYKLLNCAKLLKQKNNEFILDIYGEGPLEDDIKELIAQNRLEKNVFLRGFTKDKTVYQNYSLMWMTSDFEGLSLSMIEAKYNYVPTITTMCGDGVYEVINSGYDGYIEDDLNLYVEKTSELLSQKDKLWKFAENARKSYENFSPEYAKKKWNEILEKF